MSSPASHWFVLGAGSIGCLYAAYLQRAGNAVTLLLRDQARLQQFHAAGLTLQRDEIRWPVPVAAQSLDAIAAMPPITHLLLCTKAHHSVAAVAALLPALAPDPTIVLLQNGMGVREELTDLLPQATFVHALSTEGAWQPQRFHVLHAGRGETLVGAATAVADLGGAAIGFADVLQRSGLSARAVPDIEPHLWQKLAVNCVINPLTAVHRCRNGELLNLPDFAQHIDAICREIAAVAAAAGIPLATAALTERIVAVIHGTAANRSSMLQDIEAGRATEIDYLNGFVVRLAQHYRIDAAVNAQLHEAVKTLEARAHRQI